LFGLSGTWLNRMKWFARQMPLHTACTAYIKNQLSPPVSASVVRCLLRHMWDVRTTWFARFYH